MATYGIIEAKRFVWVVLNLKKLGAHYYVDAVTHKIVITAFPMVITIDVGFEI